MPDLELFALQLYLYTFSVLSVLWAFWLFPYLLQHPDLFVLPCGTVCSFYLELLILFFMQLIAFYPSDLSSYIPEDFPDHPVDLELLVSKNPGHLLIKLFPLIKTVSVT